MQGIATNSDVALAETRASSHIRPKSTYEMIRQGMAINPKAPALSFFLTTSSFKKPETWSYKTLFEKITQTANFLDGIAVDKHTVVAYILPNLPETHLVIWGGQAAGIVAAINPMLEATAITDLLNASEASVLVTLAPFPGSDLWQKAFQAIPKVPSLRHVILVNIADHVHGLKSIPAKLIQKREELKTHGVKGLKGSLPSHIHVYDFNTEIKAQPKNYLRSMRFFSADDVSSYFCTGGTTGTPKLAVRHHGNEIANAWGASQFMGSGIGPGKVVYCGLPLFHVNAVMVTGLMPFSRGAHVVLGTPQGYRGDGVVKNFWKIVEHYKVNFFSGVPTLYSSLLQVPIGRSKIGSLEYGLCGAAPMPVEVFKNFQERTGLKILEGYGLTEGTCVSSVNPPLGERRLGSIGLRVPGQKMKVAVLDEDGTFVRNAAVNEVGVITISGENVCSGYLLEEQNKGLWINCGDGLRWLNTGDLGRQDNEGYFWLTGRKKDLIIRGGHNIDPAMIEEPLHRHPSVQMAAAIGRPDAHAGELPVAYVQLKPGGTATESEILDFVSHEISERAAVPKYIRIVEQLPLTAVGKIFKPALRMLEIEDALKAELVEAGVSFTSLAGFDEKSLGVYITVTTSDPEHGRAAEKVLGKFPFRYTINAPVLLTNQNPK